MEFQRDIYKPLIEWTKTKKGLLLKGTRQVGKTFILNKLAKEKFKNSLYINLGNVDTCAWFENTEMRLVNGADWLNAFTAYAEKERQQFSDDGDTIVILDEIQSSGRVFNGLRQMVRECNFKVVGTGSYLGIMDIENYYSVNKQSYFYPAGDVTVMEMYPMTYSEVIAACKENGVEDLIAIGNYYVKFGGFPEVVENWINYREPNPCIETLNNIFMVLVAESQRYFHGAFPEEVWVDTLISVIKQIESKKAIPESQELVYKFRESDGLNVTRQETVDSMRWMLACNLLFLGDVVNNLKHPEKRVKYSYYIADQGLMYIILDRSQRKTFSIIDNGNIPGLMAENFVALNIQEFMRPVTYEKSNPSEEIDFIALKDGELTAIEVKFTSGEVKSSESALLGGDIKHIIKVQGRLEEPQTDAATVILLHDCHRLGELLGESPSKTKYDKPPILF